MSAAAAPGPHVLHVNTSGEAGGTGRVVRALWAGQRARGAAPVLLAGRGRSEKALEALGVGRGRFLANVLLHRLGAGEAPLNAGLWRRQMARIAAADVVHLHNAHGYYLPHAALRALLARPAVWTLHDDWALTGRCAAPQDCRGYETGCAPCPFAGRYPAAWIDRAGKDLPRRRALLAKTAALFAVPTAAQAERVAGIGVPRGRIAVVPNPLLLSPPELHPGLRAAARRRLGWPEDRCIALFVAGKLGDPNKGLATLIAGLERVREPRAWMLALAGQKNRAVRSRLSALPVETRLLGPVGDSLRLSDIYAAADLLANPSHGESFGLTNIEALAHGCALLCSDLPVFRETVGAWAAFAPAGDPDAWAAALDTFADRRPAPDLAAAGAVADRFSLDRTLDAYDALYRLVLA